MAILRHHNEKDFTIIPNSIFRDDRLNMKDIGLLCFMLHLPDGWDFSINRLQRVLPNDGRDSISASLKRIEQAGYLHREQERNKNGTLADYVWTVSDVPMEPKTENPNTENPTQIKKEIKKVRSKGFPSENTPSIIGVAPSDFAQAVAEEHDAVKQTQRRPYTFEETMTVFRTFFEEYERSTGQRHHALSRPRIRAVLRRMPYFVDGTDPSEDIDPDTYPYIIEAYFDTKFKNCDYNILHFMSGAIRKNRYHKTN